MPKGNDWKSLEESRLRVLELQERIQLLQTLRNRLERLSQSLETMIAATAQCFRELNMPEGRRPSASTYAVSREGHRSNDALEMSRPSGRASIRPSDPENQGENPGTAASEPEILTKKDAAKLLQVSPRMIDLLREKNGLPWFAVGHLVRFRRKDLISWFEQFLKNQQEKQKKSQE